MPTERESKFEANNLSGGYTASSPERRALGFIQVFAWHLLDVFFDRLRGCIE